MFSREHHSSSSQQSNVRLNAPAGQCCIFRFLGVLPSNPVDGSLQIPSHRLPRVGPPHAHQHPSRPDGLKLESQGTTS